MIRRPHSSRSTLGVATVSRGRRRVRDVVQVARAALDVVQGVFDVGGVEVGLRSAHPRTTGVFGYGTAVQKHAGGACASRGGGDLCGWEGAKGAQPGRDAEDR